MNISLSSKAEMQQGKKKKKNKTKQNKHAGNNLYLNPALLIFFLKFFIYKYTTIMVYLILNIFLQKKISSYTWKLCKIQLSWSNI